MTSLISVPCRVLIASTLLVLLSAGAACADAKKPIKTPLDSFELGKYQYCGSDRDCVVANNGCCDCANGGEDVAVNKERLEAFRERFDCLHVQCTMRASVPPCGSGLVSCINHRCKYHKREDVEFGN